MESCCCDLEVDVNGEETFIVSKNIISSYSGRLSKLLDRSKSTRKLKFIFHNFPGGAECFEHVLKFCYNNGKIVVSPSNISLLHFAAEFMEMNSSVSGTFNLLEHTQKSLKDINYWSWSELLVVLKQCQLHPVSNSLIILENCLDSMVEKFSLANEASPCPSSMSSSDSSGFRFSCDTKSTEISKTCSSSSTFWFEDLLVLNPFSVKLFVKSMVLRNFDHVLITKFLIHYQKSKFVTSTKNEKREIAGSVIEMLYTLEKNSVSCKTLFTILRISSGYVNKSSRNKLEGMIGAKLDQATLDDLLVPSPYGMSCLYDVNLVLRFLKAFLHEGKGTTSTQISELKLKKAARLIDLYMAEIAPDPCLKPSKFSALAMALPDSARDSYDEAYRAIDLYLEVHGKISEDEKMKICSVINYEKLSSEVCSCISKNPKFSLQMRADLKGMEWRVMELEQVCKKMHTEIGKILKSGGPRHARSSLPWLCS